MHRIPRPAPPPEPTPDPAFVEAVDRLVRDHGEARPAPNAVDILQVATPDGPVRAKRWPAGTTAERIAATRTLLGALSDAGLPFVPRPIPTPDGADSIAIEGGARVDLQTWLPGQPPIRDSRPTSVHVPASITVEQLAVLCTGIARAHEASAPVLRARVLPVAPLTALHKTVAQESRAIRGQLSPYIRQSPQLRAWLRATDRIIPAAADAVGALQAGDGRRLTGSHLALWPEHVLFLRQEGAPVLGGLVGWSHAAASSPLVDLSQAIVRTRGWSKESAEVAVGAYQEGSALLPEERRALPLIAALDLVLVMGQLLVARLEPPRGEWVDGLAIRGALEKLVAAADALLPVLGGYDEKAPVYRRVWEHRPPAGQPRTGPSSRPGAPRPTRGPSPRRPKREGDREG